MRYQRLFIVAAFIIAVVPEAASPGTSVLLAGHWRLNSEKSEDARQKMKEARAAYRATIRQRGESDDAEASGGKAGHGFFKPAQELTIAQNADEVTVFVKDGAIRILHADGKPRRIENGQASVRTHWEAGVLIVDIQAVQGARREAFSVSANQKELTEVVRIESRFGPVSVRRVYDAVPAE